jgi:hypothetical protein
MGKALLQGHDFGHVVSLLSSDGQHITLEVGVLILQRTEILFTSEVFFVIKFCLLEKRSLFWLIEPL